MYANWLWQLRGFMDSIFGGPGMKRSRVQYNTLKSGDTIDFWRVLKADFSSGGELLLFSEMKLPGDAWLHFQIKNETLIQTATFRPRGLLGRLYWYSVLPLHIFIFSGMVKQLAR